MFKKIKTSAMLAAIAATLGLGAIATATPASTMPHLTIEESGSATKIKKRIYPRRYPYGGGTLNRRCLPFFFRYKRTSDFFWLRRYRLCMSRGY